MVGHWHFTLCMTGNHRGFCFVLFFAFGCIGSSLQRLGASLDVVYGLSCLAAYGILVSQPGMKPVYSTLESRFLTTGLPGKSYHGGF